MAPATTTLGQLPSNFRPEHPLSSYEHILSTPVIGTEFPTLQIRDLLDSDELLLALAKTVSQRGVVFFRNQELTLEEQKLLGRKLGELTGKPKTSGLHVHPLTHETSELGDEISVISSEGKTGLVGKEYRNDGRSKIASRGWHSDITFEKVPSDYAILKIHTLPETGGDTLWASAYEAYDRLSVPIKTLLEGLTATHNAHRFNEIAKLRGHKIRESRGSPENQGTVLTAVHPVIRTNPVTGWKGLFVNRGFTKYINELSKDESDYLLEYLFRLVSENHDLQVRFKWNKNDVAIWDNRSVFHTATDDYFEYEAVRTGDRVVSLGEVPKFDKLSKGRREALGLGQAWGPQF
ncbi:hypothetical protein RUND412_007780 [Rhizina undulata]